MRPNYKRGAIAFLTVSCFLTFMWWLGGFNFDQRGEHVAFGFVATVGMAAAVAGFFTFEE